MDDGFAWRQLAWDNAQRLLSAPTPQAREAIAKEIRQHAQDKAREIIAGTGSDQLAVDQRFEGS